jgi:prepilin-type N-terminal cleavage/methylation domain-containing protein
MKLFCFDNFGFTLVELMTVTAIIFIVSAMALADYRQGNRRVLLDNEAYRFSQNVRRAQEWALSSRDFGQTAPAGFGVYVSSASSYILYEDNDGGKDYDEGEEIEEVFLDDKVEISVSIPSSADINYASPTLLGKITDNTGAEFEWARITFRVKNGTQSRVVAANIAGLVYVE